MKKFALCTLIQVLSLALASAQTYTALDTTFGTGGEATTAAGVGDSIIYASQVMADGRIIVAGISTNGGNTDFALARYTVGGILDTTFNGNGGNPVITDFNGGNDQANSLVLQIDGKIVVAGFTATIPVAPASPVYSFAVARYNTDGSLDTTFGTGGQVDADAGAANSVLVDSNGKIVVVGGTTPIANPTFLNSTSLTNGSFKVVRYNTDGSSDATFNGGSVTTTITSLATSYYGCASSAALDASGKIVVAGSVSPNSGVNSYFAVARYTSTGILDATFGTGGMVLTSFTGYDTVKSVMIQTDGKIVVAGNTGNGYSSQIAIARYNTNGTLDTTFGTGGKVTTTIAGYDVANSVIQLDGVILVAGSSSNGSNSNFALACYNPNGSLNTNFTSTGTLTTDFFGSTDAVQSLAVLGSGEIVAAGYANNGTQNEFAVARYLVGGSLNPVNVTTPYSYNTSYGLLYNSTGNSVYNSTTNYVYTNTELGTLSFATSPTSTSEWAYSSWLTSWLWGNGYSNWLFSYDYGYMYLSGDGDNWYWSACIGWIYTGNFGGAVWSQRFGWVWANGDQTYFYSWYYGWLKNMGYGQVYSMTYGRNL
jgi:uncharacterized delta-60 repeat protein